MDIKKIIIGIIKFPFWLIKEIVVTSFETLFEIHHSKEERKYRENLCSKYAKKFWGIKEDKKEKKEEIAINNPKKSLIKNIIGVILVTMLLAILINPVVAVIVVFLCYLFLRKKRKKKEIIK